MMDDRGASRHAVIANVLRDVFDWQQHLVIDDAIPQTLAEIVADHGVTLRPDFGYFDEAEDDASEGADSDEDDSGLSDTSEDEEQEDDEDSEGDDAETSDGGTSSGPWKLLGMVTAWGTHPLTRTTTGTWTANAVERLAVLLRARDVPVGIVTDGRWWALVTAPRGGATGAAVWDASLFSEEPKSLAGLVALLTRSRFQAAQPKDKLPALFAESLERQEEVTEQLGRQVREAVELLVTTLDQLDRESNGTLLAGVSDDDFYAGVVTMMMRVVFLLFAEERRLLPSDDDLYVTAYSVGHLVEQLEQADSLGADARPPHRRLAPAARGHPRRPLRCRARGPAAARLRRRPVRPRPLPVARRPPRRRHARRRGPAARRGRPHRAAHAPRRAVRGHRRRAPPPHLPRPGRGADRLRLRRPARTGGPHRHRDRARPGPPAKWPQKIKEDAEVALRRAQPA